MPMRDTIIGAPSSKPNNQFLPALMLGMLAAFPARSSDWPQWRGPNRDGISAERISINWSTEGPKLLWRASVGTGFSSIAVSEGRAYTMGNTEDKDTIWCFDARSGKDLWKYTYESKLGAVYYEGGPGST